MRSFILAVFIVGSGGLVFTGCNDHKSRPPPAADTHTSAPEVTSLEALGWQGSRGVVGVSFVRQFPAAGGRQPYTWSVFSGTLPPGLNLDSNGQLSGTPTQAGEFSYAYQVQDQTGSTSVVSTTQTVQATGTPPSFKITAPSGIPTFTGTTFSFQPFMEGGVRPVTWSYILPPNIQFSPTTGALSGQVSSTGSFTAEATATDVTGAQASPITFNFGVNLGGTGVTQPPNTIFDGIWDVTYSGDLFEPATGIQRTVTDNTNGFAITNGVVDPSGNINQALNTISDVTIQIGPLGLPFKLGGGISSAGTASGTWDMLAGSGWVATNTTWTATRR
jgi:hypothetical protein